MRIKYGDHETDTVTGVLIYPDDFSFSEVGVSTMKFGSRSNRLQAELDKATWESLESAGCVFLPFMPALTYNEGSLRINEENYGQALSTVSADAYNSGNSRYCTFSFTNASPVAPNNAGARYFGMPVRLVQDYTKK